MKIKDFSTSSFAEQGEVDEKLAATLKPLVSQVDHLTQALQGRVDLEANEFAELITFAFEHDVAADFPLSLRGARVLGAEVIWSGIFDYPRLAAETYEKGIRLKVKWDGGDPGKAVTCRVLVYKGEI